MAIIRMLDKYVTDAWHAVALGQNFDDTRMSGVASL
jgi:hypothetical protein